jgi:YidC/Oxa1 family membrane protein insertase
MLDGFFDLIASLLNFFYGLVPDYAIAIALLTCTIMIITTPLTMKSTRSMIEMQRLQPEIRRLQQQYKDDRQKLNEEMMAFYKEHQINPLGGCLPILVQAPVFSILFWVIRGLTNKANFEGLQKEAGEFASYPTTVFASDTFQPKYLDRTDELYQSLLGETEMRSFGVDLAVSPAEALQGDFVTALPYLGIVAVIGVLSWYQSKQIMGRNKSAEITPQQKMMSRIGPAMFVAISFSMPAALCAYFLTSTVWRVGQQGYITHKLYKGEDSVGAQAQKAMAEARADKDKGKDKDKAKPSSNGTGAGSSTGKDGGSRSGKGDKSSGNGAAKTTSDAATGKVESGAGQAAKPHPRSRKKKKRK